MRTRCSRDIPLYYQQLFIYESSRMNRNGGQYGNEQFNYDWGIVDWTVEPDESGKKCSTPTQHPCSSSSIPG